MPTLGKVLFELLWVKKYVLPYLIKKTRLVVFFSG